MVLSNDDINELKKLFESLKKEVKIYVFTSNSCGEYCDVMVELLNDLKKASDKIVYETFDLESEKAKELGIRSAPSVVFAEKPNMQYWGLPSGHEFKAFLEDIHSIGAEHVHIHPNAKEIIEKIDIPIEIWVFVTPTCPYCPIAVSGAHKFAYVNENIKGVMIEAIENEQLANEYNVSAVPKIVIRDARTGQVYGEWEGAMPEDAFAQRVLETLA